MKFLTYTVLLNLLSAAAVAQNRADTSLTQIRQLLIPGKHQVHYYRADPSHSLTAGQKALLERVRGALTENTLWVIDPDSAKHIVGTRDQILDDVRKKLQLTEAEWQDLQNLTDVAKKDAVFYGNDTLDIVLRGSIICFRGTGKASGIDSVSFDLSRNVALFRQQSIPFMNIFHISPSDNGFHTPVLTYAYEFNKHYLTDSTDETTLHIERFDFGVSHMPRTGKK